MAKLHVHLKAGHGRTELRNGSIQIVAEPGKTVDVDAKQYRLAMSSKIFAKVPFKAKNADAGKAETHSELHNLKAKTGDL
jgi:hypothetical protein